MYGLDAISAHNGWAMAVVGATIIFSGLIVLSLAISQLTNLLKLWDNGMIMFRQIYMEKIYSFFASKPCVTMCYYVRMIVCMVIDASQDIKNLY